MKKLSIALTLLLCVSAFADATYVAPVSPVRFRQNQDYQILSYILLDRPLGPKAEVYVNGECADMEQTSRADSVLVWLPMFGNEMRMTVKDGKEMVMDRAVMPFVPSDWGYFRNGTIHIIQSSHQDIGWMDTPERCREDRIENIILPALEMMEKNPSLGFYPIDPVSCRFVIGAPQIDGATMRWDNGKTFTVQVERPTGDCIFVKETYLNGTLLDRPYITYDEIMDGGTLRFVMYDRPDRDELLPAR